MNWVFAIAALAVGLAIFATTPAGKRVLTALGLDRLAGAGVPPREDRDFLLRSCGGDREAVEALLEAQRQKFPDLDEAQIHRRAIRIALRGKQEAGS